MPIPFLSVIIPAYNEEHRLPGTLDKLLAFLNGQAYSSEVLVVENGSTDRTFEIAEEYSRGSSKVRAVHSEERGKGLAVRLGMLEAKGEYRFMCDADLSMPVTEINCFLPPLLRNYDIAIASREAPGAVRYNEPRYRHFVGRGFNTLIRLIALPGLNDTQCGFKCFRGELVSDLFRRQTLKGWSFDVELLFIARKMGLKIVEVPIGWYFNPDSKIKVLRDSFQMGADLLTIRLNSIRGVYDL